MAILKVAGIDVQITVEEYDRFKQAVIKKGSAMFQNFRVLNNGVIVNFEHVATIIPDAADVPIAMVAGEVAWPIGMEERQGDMFDPSGDMSTRPEEPAPITKDELENIMLVAFGKKDELALAKALGYSRGTVHMAVKEGRMSREFCDAVRAKYFPAEPKTDGPGVENPQA